jgi:hypothetical protein
MDDAHAVPLTQAVIPMGRRCQVAQAGDHGIAERAGDELTPRLDQRHLDRGVSAPDILGTCCTTKATANHHDASGGLRPGPTGKRTD